MVGFSLDTKIATPEGWRKITDLRASDLVLGVSPNKLVGSWVPVLDVSCVDYEGYMFHFGNDQKYKSSCLSVTDTSRLLWVNPPRWEIGTSKGRHSRSCHRMANSCHTFYEDSKFEHKDFLKLTYALCFGETPTQPTRPKDQEVLKTLVDAQGRITELIDPMKVGRNQIGKLIHSLKSAKLRGNRLTNVLKTKFGKDLYSRLTCRLASSGYVIRLTGVFKDKFETKYTDKNISYTPYRGHVVSLNVDSDCVLVKRGSHVVVVGAK